MFEHNISKKDNVVGPSLWLQSIDLVIKASHICVGVMAAWVGGER